MQILKPHQNKNVFKNCVCLLLSHMLSFAVKIVFAAVLFLLLTVAKQVVYNPTSPRNFRITLITEKHLFLLGKKAVL